MLGLSQASFSSLSQKSFIFSLQTKPKNNSSWCFRSPEVWWPALPGSHQADGGPAGAPDWRPGQAGRRRDHLPPEHQEGQGPGRGLHQAPRVLHQPPKVGYPNIVYPKKLSLCLQTSLRRYFLSVCLSDTIKCILFCLPFIQFNFTHCWLFLLRWHVLGNLEAAQYI